MVSCVVTECKNSSTKNSKEQHGISFHRFPREHHRRRLWEKAVCRGDWRSSKSSTVCSEHFVISDFYLTEGGLRRLSLEAVPSINISPFDPKMATASALCYEARQEDLREIKSLKKKIKRLEVISHIRKKRIYKMWQEKQNMQRQITALNNAIKQYLGFNKGQVQYSVLVPEYVELAVTELQPACF